MGAAWREVRWFIAYWISRFAIQFGHLLPTRLCYAVANPIADLCFLILTRHRRNLVENLRRVVGDDEARPAARRAFRNFGRYVVDFYQLPALGHDALAKRVVFDDWENLDAALDYPRGVVGVTLHLGQAELGGATLSTFRHPINAIAETLEYGPMNDFIQGLRTGLGMKVIMAKKGKAAKPVMRALHRGEVLAMLIDAVEPGEGVEVELFGAKALVSSAPARIALRCGSRVLTAIVARDPDDPIRLLPSIDYSLLGFEPTGDEEADVRALTQAIASSCERYIRSYPDQWFAFRNIWQTPESNTEIKGDWRLWSLQAAVKLGGWLPRWASYGLARLAGDLAYWKRESTRRDVEDNMRHVVGPDAPEVVVKQYAREAFRNVARYYVDLIRMTKTTPDQLLRDARLHGFDRLTEPLRNGQGVIVATAHFGNPEVGVQVGAILGLNTLVLAEPLRPPAFARLMREIRGAFGPRYADVGFSTIADAIRHLRAGGCLAITCDRNIQGTGVAVPFFGVETKLPLGAVELAQRTGALLMPAYCRRSASGFDIFFEEPLRLVDTGRPKADALVNARSLLARAEEWIGSDPGQWMTLDRIWVPVVKTGAAPEARDDLPPPLATTVGSAGGD